MEGKDPKDVGSYTLAALKNLLCKIFKNMTNKSQIWMGSGKSTKPKQSSSKSRKPIRNQQSEDI